MPRSKTFTEWVSAPTEMKSTPVSATSRARSKVSPPEASRRGPAGGDPDRLGHRRGVHVVEQDPVAAGVEQLAELVEVGDLDLHREVGVGRAHGSYAGTTPPAATTWLSLTIAMSERLNRWLTPPPQRTAYFCRAR